MTPKERVKNALEGKPVDRMPVTVLYNDLYYCDHFAELTGKTWLELYRWLYSQPEQYFSTYHSLIKKVPWEMLIPHGAVPRQVRKNTYFLLREGKIVRHDRKRNTDDLLRPTGAHPFTYTANEKQTVFDKEDVKKIKIVKAEEMKERYDYVRIVVEKLGKTYAIIAGGVTGILWECHRYLGQTNTLLMLLEKPFLIDYLSNKLMEQAVENIKAASLCGADAIYIDDAMAYSDIVSRKHYERFVFPCTKKMVETIHHFNHKAILIYFGGVMDRLDLIVEAGADGLSVETSMKGYTNDIGKIAELIGKKISLFGNIDPIRILQNGTEEELEKEVKRQVEAGRKARGFIISTGSPITPATSWKRVLRFLEIAREEGKA